MHTMSMHEPLSSLPVPPDGHIRQVRFIPLIEFNSSDYIELPIKEQAPRRGVAGVDRQDS